MGGTAGGGVAGVVLVVGWVRGEGHLLLVVK